MNWQGVSADLPVALILMIGAAILGGLIIWIIKQWSYRSLKADFDQKVGEHGELTSRHDLLSNKHESLEGKYNSLNTTYLDIQEKYEVQNRQLKECSTKRNELEGQVTILAPFRKKYEDLEPQYSAARVNIDDLNEKLKSLTVKATGLEDALKEERKENMELKNSLSLLHGLQGKYDESQKENSELKNSLSLLGGLQGQYDESQKENSELKNSLSLLGGLQGQYDESQKENEALKARIAELEASGASTSAGGTKEKESEADTLARVREKAKNINFDRIGLATIAEKDDLKIIKGIGPFIEKKLNALNIFTYRQIAKFTPEDEENVTDAIEFFPGRIDRDKWVPQAKGLIGGKANKEEATLARIRERAQEINFDRIGVSTADQKDDLKIIKGIGPFIEKKLNSIGIYTFAQIAKFTEEDEDKVNEVIEFFPGRIRRDGWSGQAKELNEKKEE